jgi:cation diffusion facilitator CzcD-associated flavoprotein CzcO
MENVVVIGAGQAGLAVSFFLKHAEVRHVVLERGEIGETWRSQRWDSFRFNTPNATTVMPGWPYAGSEPDGFMTQDAFVDLLERFVARHQLPVVVGANVTSVHAPTVNGPLKSRRQKERSSPAPWCSRAAARIAPKCPLFRAHCPRS